MKKIVISLMALTFLIGTATGCGENKKSIKSNLNKNNSEEYIYTGEGPITNKTEKLSILAPNSWYTGVDFSKAEIIQEVIKRSGIEVDFQLLPPGNYKEAVTPRLASGINLPDIICLPNLDHDMKYINAGLFIPIDEYYEKQGVNLKMYYKENSFIKDSLTTSEGKMYYVPQISAADNFQVSVMVNEVWLEALGINEPKTLDDMTNMLRKFKSEDPNRNGKQDEIPLSIQAAYLPYAFATAFGIDLVSGFYADDSGQVHFAYSEPGYKEYLIYLNSLYKEGLLEPEIATLTRAGTVSRFSEDITGATVDYSWQMSQTYSPLYEEYTGEEGIIKGIAPLAGPDNNGYYIGREAISGVFGISKDCENPELAFKFLDFASSLEAQELYVWGIEGKSYTIENGEKVYTKKSSEGDFLQKLGINPACMPSRQSVSATYALIPQWHMNYDKKMKEYIKKPWPFIYSLPEEGIIQNKYMEDVEIYVSDMNIKFITGLESIDGFDHYLEVLKTMNVEAVLKVKQLQYDRYKKLSEKE